MSEQNELCPVCGMGHVHRQIEMEAFEYKGAQLQAEDYFDVCDTCGTEQATERQMRDSVRAQQRARKRHDGLLMGDEIKTIRTALGLTQDKAQELFGTGPVSFSKYEHDDVLHSRLLDRTLRLMRKDRQYLAALAAEAGVTLDTPAPGELAKLKNLRAPVSALTADLMTASLAHMNSPQTYEHFVFENVKISNRVPFVDLTAQQEAVDTFKQTYTRARERDLAPKHLVVAHYAQQRGR